jgi:hypothetical protein
VGRGDALGRRVPRPQDPPGRRADRRHPAHDRVGPLRDRRVVGERRALARDVGGDESELRRVDPERRRCSSGSRCPRRRSYRASKQTAPASSTAAAATAARCAPSASQA